MRMKNLIKTHTGKQYEIKSMLWLPNSKPKKINTVYYKNLFSDMPKEDAENSFDLYFLIHDLLGDIFGSRYSTRIFTFDDLVNHIISIWSDIDEDEKWIYQLLETHFYLLVDKGLINELFLPN